MFVSDTPVYDNKYNRMKLYVKNLKLSRNELNATFPHEELT